MLFIREHSSTSNKFRVQLRHSSTGQGLPGLDHTSTGLIIGLTADNESSATTYTVAASNVETITTLGTYAAPSASKCRFKAVDGTNHPGLYEVQFADARFSVSGAKLLNLTISGATNLSQYSATIQLEEVPVDASGLAAALAGSIPVNVNSPATSQHLDIYRGDHYVSTDGTGRTLDFTFQTGEPWPDTLNEAHFYCKPTQETLDKYPSAASLSDVAMTVVTPTGSSRKVRLTLTNTQTATLQAALEEPGDYVWWIIANKSANDATLRSGTMIVRPDPTAT